MKKFPHYRQLDAMDCGPTCLRMIAKFYGRNYSLQTLREKSYITREGVSMLGISEAAEAIGFRTTGVRVTTKQLKEDVPLPCILHWNQRHFVVLYDIKEKKGETKYFIADPATQCVRFDEKELHNCWVSTVAGGDESGTALLLNPSPEFYTHDEEDSGKTHRGLFFFSAILISL